MPIVVSAVLYGSQTPPMVAVSVTGLTTEILVDVWREPPGEEPAAVRGGIARVPTGDAFVVLDTEAELGRPLVYVAQTVKPGGAITQTSSAPITVPDPGRHVLSDSYTGAAVLVDLIATPDSRGNAAAGSLLHPAGREFPVAIHDIRTSDEGELVVHTRSRMETLALKALMASGAPIVSRHPFDGCDVIGREVLYVPRTARDRRTTTGARVWTMPFTAVATPDPTLATPLPTLMDLSTYVPTTLLDISTSWATLLGISRSDLGTAA